MKRVWRQTTVGLALVALAAVAFTATGAGREHRPGKLRPLANYPRSQTLITSGTQWGNIAGTNPYVGNYAAGMVGLVNETLLRFDPVKGKYINWLAQSAKFTGPKSTRSSSGPGSSGRTASRSGQRRRLQRQPRTLQHGVLEQPLRQPEAADQGQGNTVVFNFKGTPNYEQWQNLMWNLPMISPSQAKDSITERGEPDHVQPGQPDRHRPVRDGLVGLRPDHEGRLGEEGALVGVRRRLARRRPRSTSSTSSTRATQRPLGVAVRASRT